MIASVAPDPAGAVGPDWTFSVVFATFRWAGYVGLALLAGGLMFLVACWSDGFRDRRVRRVLLAGWLVSMVSAIAVLPLQGIYLAGGSLSTPYSAALLEATLQLDYGRYVVARIVLLVVGGFLLALAVRDRPRSAVRAPRTISAVVLGLVLPVTWAGTGHANASGELTVPIAHVAHLVTSTCWLGGLTVLLFCVFRQDGTASEEEVGRVVARFSRVAAACVATLAATGVYRVLRDVGSVGELAGSTYGALLVFKIAAVVLVVWFGSMSRAVVRTRFSFRAAGAAAAGGGGRRGNRADRGAGGVPIASLRWSVLAEALIVLVVLGVTAVLVATPIGSH
ncbi:putative copper export protein [Herbihabitans rhizosphaerae]|uniref:Putative copper export protein n=1 Tax=Herbihabitans rhizosphaerae TaxID=1872711 RepID=A0A4V2ES49_9PSEU|nr:CopD family protein [Herbihabitans rhizosphaerae]RZS36333.1 putative copper export protein [Herbihabitans rhizosphaerae]